MMKLDFLKKNKKVIVPPLVAFSIFTFSAESSPVSQLLGIKATFLVLPSFAGLFTLTTSIVFSQYLGGGLSDPISGFLEYASLGVFLHLLFLDLPGYPQASILANPMLLVSLLIGIYRLISLLPKNQPALETIIKTGGLISAAVILGALFKQPYLKNQELLDISAAEILSVAFTWGLSLAALTTILPLLQRLDLRFSRLEWLNSHRAIVSILGSFTALYILKLRETVTKNLEASFQLVEWGALSIFAVFCFLLFMHKNYRGKKRTDQGTHREESKIQRLADERQDELTEAMEKFIDKKEKEELIIHLVSVANDAELPRDEVKNSLKELINYQEGEIPLLTTSNAEKHTKEKRKNRRKEVLERTIRNLRKYRLDEVEK